ncbi:putative collagen alpha-2(IV) chain isoform X2 [Penaeus vannamei]|uniref:Putative collagen alpha-2(IV) chain isoform X2 n=1 Tax=Penaeus vannamei TaxID=6689 RepID=A0A423T465_PENVA|nr:putative collagen alpha-2(IV) chain isoform X2 [Penaeus vannamei]
MAIADHLVCLALGETKGHPDHEGHQGYHPLTLVIQGLRDPKGHRVSQGELVHKALEETLGLLARTALRVRLEVGLANPGGKGKGEDQREMLGRFPRAKGPAGERGERGHTSNYSVRGTRGDQGDPGLREAGPQGERGEDGDPGVEGYPGPPGKGECGDPGREGIGGGPGQPGLFGDIGLTGPLGPAGRKGTPGGFGKRGGPGRGGDRGFPGLEGFRGVKGTRGEPGDQGRTGAPGTPGFPGPPGEPGASRRRQARSVIVTRHSQESYGPECPLGATKLWEGFSLLYVLGNHRPHGQDLGAAGSCIQEVQHDALSLLQREQHLSVCTERGLLYWLSTPDPFLSFDDARAGE